MNGFKYYIKADDSINMLASVFLFKNFWYKIVKILE